MISEWILTKYLISAGTTLPSSMYSRISLGVPIMRPIEAFDCPLSGEALSFADFNSALWMIYFAALKHCNANKICKGQNQFIKSRCIHQKN